MPQRLLCKLGREREGTDVPPPPWPRLTALESPCGSALSSTMSPPILQTDKTASAPSELALEPYVPPGDVTLCCPRNIDLPSTAMW